MAVVEERGHKKPRQPRKPRNAQATQELAQEIPTKTNKQLKKKGTTEAKNQNNSSPATVSGGENPKKKGSSTGKKQQPKGEAVGSKRKNPERERQTVNKTDGWGSLADVAAKRMAKHDAEGSKSTQKISAP